MQDLFFEGRTLKPYVNSVRQADLVVGHTYFQSGFIDEDMAVPELSAVGFLGKDLNPRLPRIYFQDARSYFAGTRPEAETWASAPAMFSTLNAFSIRCCYARCGVESGMGSSGQSTHGQTMRLHKRPLKASELSVPSVALG